VKIAVIVVNVILILSLMPIIVMVGMSTMMFDSPGSTNSIKTWMFFGFIVALPIVIIIAQIISWIAFFKQNYGLALKINALPALDILIIFFISLFMSNFSD
jgi:hypothetical protein